MAANISDAHVFLLSLPPISVLAFPQLDFQSCLALSFITAVLTPCFRRGSVERYGILALQLYFTLQAYFAPVKPTGNVAVSYTTGVLLGNLTLRYFDRLWLHVPEEEFCRIQEDGIEERPETLSLSQKLWWSFELLASTRGVGWNWRVSGTPKAEHRTRAAFVIDRFVRWIAMFGCLLLAERICEGILNEWVQLSDTWMKSVLLAVSHNSVFLYSFVVLAFSLAVYTHFAMLTLPLAMICVGLGIGPVRWRRPDAWPATFNSLAEASSIRRFWSHCWHQQIRRPLSIAAGFVLSQFPSSVRSSSHLPTRLFRRYFALLFTFMLSGVFHTVGHSTVLRARRAAGDNDTQTSIWGEMPFFVAQGLGIVAEDLVYHMFNMDSRRGLTLRYVATATWYAWTRVQLKAIPMAATFGISDGRGQIFEVVEVARLSLEAIPGNFVKMGLERWL